MTNVNLLKGKMVANGYTQKTLCAAIRMPTSTFTRRLKKRVFMSDEIEQIAKVLRLTPEEINQIFFN